jgi:futalosine hydrolase
LLVLICSVELEAEPLRSRIRASVTDSFGGKPGLRGRLGDRSVILLTGGMGKTNAAHALTAVLERERVEEVVGFGVGGAYPGSGLSVGDVAVATEEIYGDEGVQAPDGWISTEGIGIPLATRAGRGCFNLFPLPADRVAAAVVAVGGTGMITRSGPFVTVSSCSGTAARGAELAHRFGAICETMEGAAYVHVATLYDLPALEIRGISNMVEDRKLANWRLRDAAESAARAVAAVCGAP